MLGSVGSNRAYETWEPHCTATPQEIPGACDSHCWVRRRLIFYFWCRVGQVDDPSRATCRAHICGNSFRKGFVGHRLLGRLACVYQGSVCQILGYPCLALISYSYSLNLRATFTTYRLLYKYLTTMDEEARARGEGPEDTSLDADFRSGVYLGGVYLPVLLSIPCNRIIF